MFYRLIRLKFNLIVVLCEVPLIVHLWLISFIIILDVLLVGSIRFLGRVLAHRVVETNTRLPLLKLLIRGNL